MKNQCVSHNEISNDVIFVGNYRDLPPRSLGKTLEIRDGLKPNEIAVDFGKHKIWAVKRDEIQPINKTFWQKIKYYFHSCDKNKKVRTSYAMFEDGKMYTRPHEWAVCKICGRKWIDDFLI